MVKLDPWYTVVENIKWHSHFRKQCDNSLNFYLCLYLICYWAGSLMLRGFCSSWSKRGLLSSCDARGSRCSGFSHWGPLALENVMQVSLAAESGLSSCGSQALEHRLSSFGSRGLVVLRHAGSSQIRDWTHVLALAGRFFTTEPQRKPIHLKK